MKACTLPSMCRRISSCMLIVAVFMVLSGCGSDVSSSKIMEAPPIPEQALEQFTVSETEKGQPQWVLNAASAQINETQKRAVLQFPRVKFYEHGAYVSTLVAARGVINMENYDIVGEGACTLDTAKGERLETRDLRYRSDTKKIVTDAPVTLIREGETIHGTGMEATPDLETIIIRKQRVELTSLPAGDKKK